jgi:excisionase family DNA binding protein
VNTYEHYDTALFTGGTEPMRAMDEEYVTVAEAAALLRVATSTIRRWIREGDVPAHRIGRRRVALRRADLAGLITPARPAAETKGNAAVEESVVGRRLTPEEQQRAFEAMDRAQELAKRTFEERGGKLFPPAWITINEQRDERTRQLS